LVRPTIGFALGAILLLATSGAALACSCAPNPTAAGIRQSASAVFTGVAVASRNLPGGRAETTFKITESFKGPAPGETVRVQHGSGPSASCGVTFAVGETHTLAAHAAPSGQRLSTNLCSVWMFLPHVGLSERLISELRALRDRR
jgi:hypothetical protein